MKKLLTALLVLTLTVTMFAGCSTETKPADAESQATDTKEKETATEETKDSTEEAEDGAAALQLPITEKLTTFTVFNMFGGRPFNPEWEVWKKAAELTNIQLESIISQSTTDEDTSFNMMLSSGELADAISYRGMADLEKLGQDGGLIPLNDLIKEHAPNIQKLLDENPEYLAGIKALDGNIYFVPKIDKFPVAQAYWVRQDWLDKLGLEQPTNLEELYTVLKAFKTQDPNGNGMDDEIPYFDRDATWYFDNVLYIWDASSTYYARDGKVTFGPLEDEFKYGMTEVIKWYEEGLIDPEIFTRGGKSRDTLLGGDIGGMTHDWIGSTSSYNDKLAGEIEGFNFVPMAPPANQKGEQVERTYRYPVIPGWGISSQCEDPVTLIKFFDFFFSQEGHDLINYGIEGVTYNKTEAGIEYTDAIMDTDTTPLAALRAYGSQYRLGMIQDFAYEAAMVNDLANVGYDMYADGGFVKNPIPQIGGGLNLRYTEEEAKEYNKIMTDITSYVSEMIQKWVLGASDFDADYEGFVAELKSRGIDRALEINQAAYDRFLNN